MERERYLGEGRGLRPDAAVMAYDGGAREWTAGGGQGRGRTVAAGGGQARGRGRRAATGGGQARGRGSCFSRGCAGQWERRRAGEAMCGAGATGG
jgi:hypothetical protein